MRASFGNGGWVAVDGLGLPGPLYVRVRLDERRLRIQELYLDASGGGAIDAQDLRELPLAHVEAFINEYRDTVINTLAAPAPDLSTLASYYGTSFGFSDGESEASESEWLTRPHWVAISYLSQFDRAILASNDVGHVQTVKRSRHKWKQVRETDRDFVLRSGPGKDGLTDEFLTSVARAYAAALARGERPNVAIAKQLGKGHSVKTVQRWVHTARQRGIMPRGSRGKPG